jgi:hypothetical protein
MNPPRHVPHGRARLDLREQPGRRFHRSNTAALLGAMRDVSRFPVSLGTVHPVCLALPLPVAAAGPWLLPAVRALAADLLADA